VGENYDFLKFKIALVGVVIVIVKYIHSRVEKNKNRHIEIYRDMDKKIKDMDTKFDTRIRVIESTVATKKDMRDMQENLTHQLDRILDQVANVNTRVDNHVINKNR